MLKKTSAGRRPLAKKGGRPGKFEASGSIGEKLHEITLNGFQDDECGDVQYGGWYGLITGSGIRGATNVVVSEDNNGFVDYTAYPSAAAARKAFDKIAAAIAEEDSEG